MPQAIPFLLRALHSGHKYYKHILFTQSAIS